MASLARIVARNSAYAMGAQFSIKALSFAFSVLVVRHLGPEEFGQYSAVQAFGAMFLFLADLGLSPYAVRQVARWRGAPDHLGRTGQLYGSLLILRLILSVLTVGVVLAAARLTDRPMVMILAIGLGGLGLVAYGVQGASDAILAGFERLDRSAIARVVNQLTFVLLGAFALWLGAGYYGLLLATIGGAALTAYLCWGWVRQLGVCPSSTGMRDWPGLLRASLPFAIGGVALGLSYKFDSVLLQISRGDAETGFYSAAYNFVFSSLFVANAVNTALYPSLSRRAVSSPETLPAIYERTFRYLVMLGLPIAVGTAATADRLVPLLFTERYSPAIPALQVVIWATPLMFVSDFLGYVIAVQGRERRTVSAVLTSTSLNVAVNLLLVPRVGFLVAAAMTVVTEAVLVGQYVWILRALLREFDLGRILVRPAAAALLTGSLLLLLHPLPLFVLIPIGVAAYGGLLLGFRVVGSDEIQLLRRLNAVAPSPATT